MTSVAIYVTNSEWSRMSRTRFGGLLLGVVLCIFAVFGLTSLQFFLSLMVKAHEGPAIPASLPSSYLYGNFKMCKVFSKGTIAP